MNRYRIGEINGLDLYVEAYSFDSAFNYKPTWGKVLRDVLRLIKVR